MFGAEADLNVVKVYLHYNGWWAVDFTAAGVHKGAAAIVLAERMGAKPKEFIAAGDSFNDLPMLESSRSSHCDGFCPSVNEGDLPITSRPRWRKTDWRLLLRKWCSLCSSRRWTDFMSTDYHPQLPYARLQANVFYDQS